MCDLESFIDVENDIAVLYQPHCINTPVYYAPYKPRYFKSLLTFEVYLLSTVYLIIRFLNIQDPMKLYDFGNLQKELNVSDKRILRVCRDRFNTYETCDQFLIDIFRVTAPFQNIITVNRQNCKAKSKQMNILTPIYLRYIMKNGSTHTWWGFFALSAEFSTSKRAENALLKQQKRKIP